MPKNNENTTFITVRIDKETDRQLRIQAAERRESRHKYILDILKRAAGTETAPEEQPAEQKSEKE